MIFDELSEYRLDYKDNKFFIGNNIFIICTYIILFILTVNITKILKNIDNKMMFLFIIIMCLSLLVINFQMSTNKYLTKKYVDPKILSKKLNTGDIVLFRNYNFDNICIPLYHTTLCLQKTFFTHSGIIYKNSQGKILIIESNQDPYYCNLSKKMKSGFQIMDFVERVSSTKNHRVHVYKSNLHKYIDMDKFNNSINKYKEYEFNQDGLYCLNLITNILQENNIMKENNLIPYMIDDVIDSKHYLVPVIFEEPILVKEYEK